MDDGYGPRMTTLPFREADFRIADEVGLMPLMQFAKTASGGADSNEMAGLVAMYNLIESCLADDDEWQRFQDHAVKTRATADDLMGFVAAVIKEIADRPTSRPSDSPDGPGTIEGNSGDDSSLQVIRQFEARGRPDLAVVIQRMSQASA